MGDSLVGELHKFLSSEWYTHDEKTRVFHVLLQPLSMAGNVFYQQWRKNWNWHEIEGLLSPCIDCTEVDAKKQFDKLLFNLRKEKVEQELPPQLTEIELLFKNADDNRNGTISKREL